MIDDPLRRADRTTPLGGGAPIALGAMAGSIIGLYSGQPSGGFLVGTAVGIGVAAAIWWFDLRR